MSTLAEFMDKINKKATGYYQKAVNSSFFAESESITLS
jgi:hypothetical protein